MVLKVKQIEEPRIISPKYSFKGWDVISWFRGNWTTIKELIKVGVPLLLGMQFFSDNPAMIAVFTGVGKLILDAGQYWFKEYASE